MAFLGLVGVVSNLLSAAWITAFFAQFLGALAAKKNNNKFNNLECELPIGESLKDVIRRLLPFLNNYFDIIKNSNGDHLIVAHSNSLRAIVKILEGLSETEIIEVNIPTGVPLVYKLDNMLNIIDKKYLIDEETLKKKKEIVENQGKIK